MLPILFKDKKWLFRRCCETRMSDEIDLNRLAASGIASANNFR